MVAKMEILNPKLIYTFTAIPSDYQMLTYFFAEIKKLDANIHVEF